MRLLTILFEDHTAENFRPLAWSRPVYEIPCGLHTTRERIGSLLRRGRPAAGQPPALALLPRRHLEALHGLDGPVAGRAVGPDACRRLLPAAERVLWLAARLGLRWDVPAELIDRARAGGDFAWSDGEGLLACSGPGALGLALLDDWEAWRQGAERDGCWSRESLRPPRWRAASATGLPQTGAPPVGPGGTEGGAPLALARLWDLVPALGGVIAADLSEIEATGEAVAREPFGVRPAGGAAAAPTWLGQPRPLRPLAAAAGAVHASATLLAPGAIWAADGVEVAAQVVIDARGGPVILDRGVRVQPLVSLEGPVYLGPGALVKAGARLGPDVAVGGGCKVAGEIAETLLCEFSNKQHDGFLGHAVVGSWVNLGAGTTCSDLKNNYGPVRIDLGLGLQDTGLRFLGPLIGDHAKTAIGTLLNTGAVVGFATNVFGAGFPPKRLPNFTWGADPAARHEIEPALATARVVLARRGIRFAPEHEALFRFLAAAAG